MKLFPGIEANLMENASVYKYFAISLFCLSIEFVRSAARNKICALSDSYGSFVVSEAILKGDNFELVP